MQDGRKAVWSSPYVSVAFFPSLKHNFIAYSTSKVSDCIFEIHRLWQSGFSRVYFNCCCTSSFEREIMKIGQSSHKMYSSNILNFQKSTTILNACTKKDWKLIEGTLYLSALSAWFIEFAVCSMEKIRLPFPKKVCPVYDTKKVYPVYDTKKACPVYDTKKVCPVYLMQRPVLEHWAVWSTHSLWLFLGPLKLQYLLGSQYLDGIELFNHLNQLKQFNDQIIYIKLNYLIAMLQIL